MIGVSYPIALRTLNMRSGHYVSHELGLFILRKNNNFMNFGQTTLGTALCSI